MVKSRRLYWYKEARCLWKVVEMQCEVTDHHLHRNWKQRLKLLANKVQLLQWLERRRKHHARFLPSPTWQRGIGQLKCDGTRAETRFGLPVKRTSPFKSVGASVQSTTGSRGVRISGSNAGYTMFRGSVKGIGYPLHSPVSPSLPLPCVTVCHHISTWD